MKDFIYNPPKTPFLEILFEDDSIMVVNKPSGLLSVPGRGAEHFDSIISRIREKYKNAQPVHRLDMDTSGLMVVGLEQESISKLGKMFEKREVKKLYVAIVDGQIEKRGKIELPIRCDIENRPLQIVDFKQGKPSVTLFERTDEYCVAGKIEDCSVVILTPVTGRSHQLRVHLSSIGHPIIGDRFYAKGVAKDKADRLCLHAFRLEFAHPITGKLLSFTSKASFFI
ncbi:MAG: RluA family pseudouridine synthase [Succinivibrio sp.]